MGVFGALRQEHYITTTQQEFLELSQSISMCLLSSVLCIDITSYSCIASVLLYSSFSGQAQFVCLDRFEI